MTVNRATHTTSVNAQMISGAPVRFCSSAPAAEPLVLTRQEGPVRYITMNRHDGQNRLNRAMFKALNEAFEVAESDPDTRTIVLESAVDRYFSPGADLVPLFQETEVIGKTLNRRLWFLPKAIRKPVIMAFQFQHIRQLAMDGHFLMNRIANAKKVTVALVNGMAVGGGVELALACDYILASHPAKFAMPEVKYGIFPDWGGTERVPQRVGPAMAKFFILEGGLMGDRRMEGPATLTAAEAQRVGLIDDAMVEPMLGIAMINGMKRGRFLIKPKRPQTPAEIQELDQLTEKRLDQSGFPAPRPASRLLEKFHRYQKASLDELCEQELKRLYKPALKLALRRIREAPKITRWQHERDIAQMIQFAQNQAHRMNALTK